MTLLPPFHGSWKDKLHLVPDLSSQDGANGAAAHATACCQQRPCGTPMQIS